MSSNNPSNSNDSNRRSNRRNKESDRINNIDNKKDNDFDEADKLLAELDRMEKSRDQNISSRVKQLIQEDKAAIRKMEDDMAKLQKDDLDYLEDEKAGDYLPNVEVDDSEDVVVKSTGKKQDRTNNRARDKNDDASADNKKNRRTRIDNSKDSIKEKENNAKVNQNRNFEKDKNSDKYKNANQGKNSNQNRKTDQNSSIDKAGNTDQNKNADQAKNINNRNSDKDKNTNRDKDTNKDRNTNKVSNSNGNHKTLSGNKENSGETNTIADDTSDVDEVKLDFFASLERDSTKQYTSIRKKQPKMLHGSNDNTLKGLLTSSKKYMLTGTAISILVIVLFVALVNDAMKNKSGKSTADHHGSTVEFLDIDTKPMIQTVDEYYDALARGDVELVRTYLSDGDKVSDKEILNQSEEIKQYYDLIGISSTITDCYVQEGLKDNEYIAYMKFQLQIRTIETPAVGIFTCYLIDDPTQEKDSTSEHNYKMYINISDKDSDIYKYIVKMSNSNHVKKLFADVDAELEQACEKDENLKAIVEALENNDASISDGNTSQESNTKNEATSDTNSEKEDNGEKDEDSNDIDSKENDDSQNDSEGTDNEDTDNDED